jgi:hypothetical protein
VLNSTQIGQFMAKPPCHGHGCAAIRFVRHLM